MSLQSELVEDYSFNTDLIHLHLNDISHPESLIQAGGTGNSLNWILGHLLLCRVEMLETLNQPSPVAVQALARYDYGSQPVRPDSTDVWAFGDLLSAWDSTDSAFLQALQNAPDEAMQKLVSMGTREVSLYRRIHFFYFHETFHIGQFEILRHLLGKTEKLI